MNETVEHLREPYRVYAIHLEAGVNKRPNQAMLLVHAPQGGPFRHFCNTYIFQHMELTIVKTNERIMTSEVIGIQKIPNGNKPTYQINPDGTLVEIG
jgi:hypothetical protein